MNKEVIIRSPDYKKGFSDAIISVIKILNENSHIQQVSLINLLNTVVVEVNKNKSN